MNLEGLPVGYLYGTKEEYSKIKDKKENSLYFCTDTKELYVGDKLFSKTSQILDSIPTDETPGDYGCLYYCKEDLNTYLYNEDGWSVVSTRNVDSLLTEGLSNFNFCKGISYNDKATIKNPAYTTADELSNSGLEYVEEMGGVGAPAIINSKNADLSIWDRYTSIVMIMQYIGVQITDTAAGSEVEATVEIPACISLINNHIMIDEEKVRAAFARIAEEEGYSQDLVDYYINNYIFEEVIKDDGTIEKWYSMTMLVDDVVQYKFSITEDFVNFKITMTPETAASMDGMIPITMFGSMSEEAGLPPQFFTIQPGELMCSYGLYILRDESGMTPGFDYVSLLQSLGIDYDFMSFMNEVSSGDLTNLKSKIVSKINKINIRLNPHLSFFTVDFFSEEMTPIKSIYDIKVESGETDVPEELRYQYSISGEEFVSNLYAVLCTLDTENGCQDLSLFDNYNISFNDQEFKDTIILPELYFRSEDPDSYNISEPYLSSPHNQKSCMTIEDLISNGSISFESAYQDNMLTGCYINGDILITKKFSDSLNDTVNKAISDSDTLNDTVKKTVIDTVSSISRITGTVDMSTIFEPGYYLVEADKILNGPTINPFDGNSSTINNKEITITGDSGEQFTFDTPSSIFMEVTEYPFNNIGYTTTLTIDGSEIEAVNYMHSIRLKLPLHTYILNRIICKPVDDYDTRIIHPNSDSDELKSGTNNQFNGWYVNDVVSAAPNFALKDNNYLSEKEILDNLTSEATNDLYTCLPHTNTKLLDTSRLEDLLENLEKTTETYVNVPTESESNYIYIPHYGYSSDRSRRTVLFKRSELSDIPSNGHESCKLDLTRFVTGLNDLNTYYYVDEISGSLYYTTNFKSFSKVFDFKDLTINADLFRSRLNKDSDTVLGTLSYNYYKKFSMSLLKRLLTNRNFVVDGDYVYLVDGSKVIAIIHNKIVYILTEGLNSSFIDNTRFTVRGTYVNNTYTQIPLLTYCDNGEIKCRDLLENKEIILFKLTDTYTKVTSFLHSRNSHKKDYTVISVLCNDKNLSTTDFTETTFRVDLDTLINSVFYSDNSERPYWHITEPYDETNYPSSITKATQTINDYVDLTDDEKQNLINILSSYSNKLKRYGGYVKCNSSSIDDKTSTSIYNAIIDVYSRVDSSQSYIYTYMYIIDNIIIFKNADGTYHKVIRADNIIKWVNITDNLYAGLDKQQCLSIGGLSLDNIDTSVKPIKYDIYGSYLLGNMNNLDIRYIPYRIDLPSTGKLMNFKGTLSNNTYGTGTYIKPNNIVKKFNISASGYVDKDNNLVKYEEAPAYNTYNNPLYYAPLNIDIGYGSDNIADNITSISNEQLFLNETSYIDLIEGKLHNIKMRSTLLEHLGIPKEKYVELINSITSLSEYSWDAWTFIEATLPDSGVAYRDYSSSSFSHNISLATSSTSRTYDNTEAFFNRLFIGGGGSYNLRLWINKDRFGISDTSEESVEKFKQIFLSLVENREPEFYSEYDEELLLNPIPIDLSHTSARLNTSHKINFDIDLLCDPSETDYITNITLSTTKWYENEEEEFVSMGYNYVYELCLSEFDPYFKRIVEIQYQDARDNIMDNLSKFAINKEGRADYVKVYAKEKPKKDINIHYIKITY